MASSAEVNQHAHNLLDRLSPGQLAAVVHLLEAMTPPDDEGVISLGENRACGFGKIGEKSGTEKSGNSGKIGDRKSGTGQKIGKIGDRRNVFLRLWPRPSLARRGRERRSPPGWPTRHYQSIHPRIRSGPSAPAILRRLRFRCPVLNQQRLRSVCPQFTHKVLPPVAPQKHVGSDDPDRG